MSIVTETSLPIVDLAASNFETALIDAIESIGFVALTGHGIDVVEISTLRSALVDLFAVTEAEKHRGAITPDNYRGFIPLGFFTPNRAASGQTSDLYEGYKLHWECPPDHPVKAACRLYGPNRWPDQVEHLRPAVEVYWASCEDLGVRLLDVFSVALGLDSQHLRAAHEAPLTNMTLLHYPPADPEDPATGIHPHKDTNTITLLHPGPVDGLEVRSLDGTWISGSVPGNALVLNVGEMLELWSGGRFRATPHRVVNRTTLDRYSFPWFMAPRHDVVVQPLVESTEGFTREPMPVGDLSAEVWRTNWANASPRSSTHDLGTLDR